MKIYKYSSSILGSKLLFVHLLQVVVVSDRSAMFRWVVELLVDEFAATVAAIVDLGCVQTDEDLGVSERSATRRPNDALVAHNHWILSDEVDAPVRAHFLLGNFESHASEVVQCVFVSGVRHWLC